MTILTPDLTTIDHKTTKKPKKRKKFDTLIDAYLKLDPASMSPADFVKYVQVVDSLISVGELVEDKPNNTKPLANKSDPVKRKRSRDYYKKHRSKVLAKKKETDKTKSEKETEHKTAGGKPKKRYLKSYLSKDKKVKSK